MKIIKINEAWGIVVMRTLSVLSSRAKESIAASHLLVKRSDSASPVCAILSRNAAVATAMHAIST